jgi:Fe-S oxidoreductase
MYYTDKDIDNYKEWEHEILGSNKLRKKYGVVLFTQCMKTVEDGVSAPCPICKTKLKTKFGDYSKPLDAKLVECPIGDCKDGHGWWMSAINVVIN